MAPRDVPAVGREHLRQGGDIHTLATMMLRSVIGWRYPTRGKLSVRWGWNFLKRGPFTPHPEGALALPTPGERSILSLIFTPRGVETQLKTFCDDFFMPAPPCLHHLVPLHLAILCFHKHRKHNVAVPINKVEGRLGGANPVGGVVAVDHHPMRGIGEGFGAEGWFIRNEGRGH